MSSPLDALDGPAPAALDPPDDLAPAPADPPDTPGAPDAPDAPNDAHLLRDLILQAHPDVVPELVQGATLHELLASLPAAQAAWHNALERLRQAGDGAPPAPAIPAGASVRSASLDLDSLSPLAKIRAAVR